MNLYWKSVQGHLGLTDRSYHEGESTEDGLEWDSGDSQDD